VTATKAKPKLARMTLFRGQVGYYTLESGPTKPAFDPPVPCNCPICGEAWTVQDVGTATVRWRNSDPSLPPLILFYRVHKACDAGLTRSQKEGLDSQCLLIGDRVSRALKAQGKA
jgi:hypothetical protein